MLKRRRWLGRILVAAGLVFGLLAVSSGSAPAQPTASVSLSKSASVSSVAPGTPFTYALKYSCSSLTTTCNGVTITDVLPPQLSLAAADVTLVGDSHTTGTAYNPATGTATFTMVNPMPAGTTGEVDITVKFPAGTTPVGAAATNVGTISATNATPTNSNPSTVTAAVTPSIATTKALNSSPIVLGAATAYTVSYTNTGNVNLTSPTLVDSLPAGATFVSASGGGVYDASKNQVTWTLPSPATPGTKASQTVTVIYPSPPFTAGTPITNTVTGTGIPLGTTTPISQPATATGTPVAPAPAVSASKSPGGAVALGRPFTYTVSVKNTGNVGLNPATMLDSLPAGATFVSATGSGTYNTAAGTVSWTNPSPPLAPGASFSATVTVTYNSPPFTAGQMVTNNLSVSGTPVTGGAPATGTASVTNTLTAPQTSGTIAKTLVTPAAQFALNTPVQYQVTAKNTGDVVIAPFTITDPLPTGATFVSASNGGTVGPPSTVTWSFPSGLGVAATQTVTVTVIFPSSTFTAGQSITNTATGTGTASGTPLTIGPSSVTNTLQPNSPAATVKKTDTTPTVAIGNSDTYTITATNSGNVALSPSFVVTDLLPANLQPDSRPATNVSFTDTRGLTAAKADILAYHNPATNAFVTVTATCTGTGTCTASIPTVADQIQITYTGSVPVGAVGTATLTLRVPPNAVDRSGNPIVAGDPIANCATVTAAQLTTTPLSCTAQTVTAPLPTMTLTKTRTSPSPVPPPSTVSWQLTFGVPATSPAPVLNPVVTDCLPVGLDLVDPANPSDPANGSPPASFTPAPTISRVVNGCGPNTIQVVWSWAGSAPALSLAPGSTGIFTLNTPIQPGTSPQTLTNTASVVADNNPTPVKSSATVLVASGASLESLKLVEGSLDSAYSKFPNVGHTTIGGSADYQLTVTNTGNIPINKVTVIDILPFVGDTAVLNVGDPRDSTWSPIMTGPVTAPPGVTVLYSTSNDPCRPELNYSPAACVTGSFSTTPPSPISSVASLEFTSPGTLAPGATVTLSWPMMAPANAPVTNPPSVAWNSFGFTGFRTDTGAQLTPAEPNKVGIEVEPYPLMLAKQVNGQSEETPPGLYIPVGTPVSYSYVVTNPGGLTLGLLNLTDSTGITILCPSGTVPPHNSIICAAAAGPAVAGQQSDTATVNGQPLINGTPAGAPATATDTANYFGSAPALTIVKDVNAQHEPAAPGLYLTAGSPVTFTYLVTNTGNIATNVSVTDSQLGVITCPQTTLAVGASETCTAAGGSAIAGQYTNTATAGGQAIDNMGAAVGSPVTSNTDSANYFGSAPDISVVKEVNGQQEPTAPGLYIPVGDPVTFTYLVTNTGNVTLNPVTLDDNVLGTITCPQITLAAGASETCTAHGGSALAGQQTNTATASGQGVDNTGAPIGGPVTADDTANYFGYTTGLGVTKSVNDQAEPTAPGLYVPQGSTLTFTYRVTNTGNVTLNPVTVADVPAQAITCPQTSLAAGDTMTCTADTSALEGQQTDTATATGQGVDNTGAPIGSPVDSLPATANYFGFTTGITVVKFVNGQAEPTMPGLYVPEGSTVTFSYLVTNTGNVTLDPVTVADEPAQAITCPHTSLAASASMTCTAAGVPAQRGQQTDTATATGQGVDDTGGSLGAPVTDHDRASYFGFAAGISVAKNVNGQPEPDVPGLYVPEGSTVALTYAVTNTGNVTLDTVTVADDPTQAITCPQTSLAAGDSMTCTADTSALDGQQTDTATATGQGVDDTGASIGAPVSSLPATANYFGYTVGISVTKDVNDQAEPTAPGLTVLVGDPVTFTYVVTNEGNVTLDPVTLDDDVLGAITCPDTSLAVGATMTCTADGGDATPGQHTNTATATGQGIDNTGGSLGAPVTDSATANYFGQDNTPAIMVVKDVNGLHEPTPPGLYVPVGDPVTFTYVVTNVGNRTLNPVTLGDSVLGAVTCPQLSLTVETSMTCTASGAEATLGQYTNTATASGQGVNSAGVPIGSPVTATDTASYFGYTSGITVLKDVDGQQEPSPPGLYVPAGSTVTFTYLVTNTGNVELIPVTVRDNVLGSIACPQPSLQPKASETCTKTQVAAAGEHSNQATATGEAVTSTDAPLGSPITAHDTADDFGSAPAITLIKEVNGQQEPAAPGLSVAVGTIVTFTYVVTNKGDVTLNAVTVTDNILGAISCPKGTLTPNQSETCSKATTARAGTQTNVGKVTAQPVGNTDQPVGAETSASDPATYTGSPIATTSSTTTTTLAAPSVTPSSPNGLGQIATDLGRWTSKSGHTVWAVTGLAAVMAGTGLFGIRRRRRRLAAQDDREPNRAG